jgi:hypothetical protein
MRCLHAVPGAGILVFMNVKTGSSIMQEFVMERVVYYLLLLLKHEKKFST